MQCRSENGVRLLDQALITEVTQAARASARGRMNCNFHQGDADNPHRFLNILTYGTYVTPHRHLQPPKSESFLVLSGRVACLIFDDRGEVTRRHVLSAAGEPGESLGIDLDAGLWHCIAALSQEAVCYEVKAGPYVAISEKEFAPWAPREGEPGCAAYLQKLIEGLS